MQPFFASTNRKYWTANQLRSTQTLGYTYPELANNANISAVKAAINKLYGSSTGSTGLSKRAVIPEPDGASSPTKAPEKVINGKHWQYMANILVQKFALNSSFAIYVFMGDFDDTPTAWATSTSLVGTHAIFTGMTGAVGTVRGAQVKTQQKPTIQVTGTMPLTSMLLEKVESGELRDVGPDSVEEYLEANLKWRVSLVGRLPRSLGPFCALLTLIIVRRNTSRSRRRRRFERHCRQR